MLNPRIRRLKSGLLHWPAGLPNPIWLITRTYSKTSFFWGKILNLEFQRSQRKNMVWEHIAALTDLRRLPKVVFFECRMESSSKCFRIHFCWSSYPSQSKCSWNIHRLSWISSSGTCIRCRVIGSQGQNLKSSGNWSSSEIHRTWFPKGIFSKNGNRRKTRCFWKRLEWQVNRFWYFKEKVGYWPLKGFQLKYCMNCWITIYSVWIEEMLQQNSDTLGLVSNVCCH